MIDSIQIPIEDVSLASGDAGTADFAETLILTVRVTVGVTVG